MNILITRPHKQAVILAEKLEKLGYKTIIEPMLEIEHHVLSSNEIDYINAADYLIITSKTALDSLQYHQINKDIKIITIGDISRDYALASGYKNVISAADGLDVANSSTLLGFIERNIGIDNKLAYIRGREVSFDLRTALEKEGYNITEFKVYDAKKVSNLTDAALNLLKSNEMDIVLLYSRRSAETFSELAEKYHLTGKSNNLKILTLSSEITKLLKNKGWSNIVTAEKTSDESIIKELVAMTDINQKKITNFNFSESIWKYAIPLVFILLALVLMLQNFLLNKKISNFSKQIEQTINDNNSKNTALANALDKKISDLFLGLDITPLKDNKDKLDEIKGLLQDIRGLSYDGNISQSDIVVEEAKKPAKASASGNMLEANLNTYLEELDKLEKQIALYQSGFEETRKELYTATEQLITDYNTKNNLNQPAVDQEKSLFAGFVKVRKTTQDKPDDYIETIKSALALYDGGDLPSARGVLEQINVKTPNEKLTAVILKIKEMETNDFTPELSVGRIKSIISSIKADIAK